jgi:diacylglycerol kinase (ATP)
LDNHAENRKHIAITCNARAGNGKAMAIASHLQQKLQQLKIHCESFTDNWPEDFNQFSAVWIVGGDGTLNYFINQYPGINIPIALFKAGSGNDFAWKLYGNKTIDEYVEIALNGNPKKTDAGICNGKYFINGTGIGFDGEVVKAMGHNKILPGHLAYLLTVLKKIFLYREKEMTIEINGACRSEKLFMVTVANGSRYGGGFLVAPQAIIDDGEFDIVLIKQIAPLLRFFYLPKMEKGNHLHLGFVETGNAKKISISSPQVLSAHLDGELMEATHFEIEILPQQFLFFR